MTPKGDITGDQPCPACVANGRDSTGNHLMNFDNGSSYCNKCGLVVRGDRIINGGMYAFTEDSSIKGKKSLETIPVPTPVYRDDPASYPSREDRGIPLAVREKYEVVSSIDPGTGELDAHFYPVHVDGKAFTHKKRKLPKDFTCLKSTKGQSLDLFGQHLFTGGKRLLITEGEEDAMAAFHMIEAEKYRVAVVSLPAGANIKAISENMDFIKKFDEVTICPDRDGPGQKLMNDISIIMPGVKEMTIPKKDACDMLDAGKMKEFAQSFWKGASVYTPETIIRTSSIIADASKPIVYGLSYPYAELTKMTYGLRIPQLIGIGAGPGAGKTTIVQSIQEHLLYTHKEKIATFSLEETPAYSLRRLAGHMMKKPIHLPGCKYDDAKLQTIFKDLEDKVFFYSQVDYDDSFDTIENTIRFLAITEGIKYFFIDPISALHAHLDASDGNTYLNHAMVRLSLLVKNLGVTVFYVSHLNNPVGSKDHGEGAKVRAGQFSGSRAMWKFSTDLIGLQRDQLSPDPDIKNTVEVVILKNRLSGETGSFMLKFNKVTGCLEDVPVVF